MGAEARWATALSFLVACVAALALLSSCGGDTAGGSATSGDTAGGSASAGSGGAGAAGYRQPASIPVLPTAPDSGGEPSIYVDQVDSGYVVAQAASEARLKFQVRNGDQAYNYDLPNDGSQQVFPINMGDGSYTFRIMQNTAGSNYVELCAAQADVHLESDFGPFLTANQFCDYDAQSACVAKARELTAQAGSEAEVVQTICEYVADTIRYDNEKAARLADETGYIPNPDETLQSGTGVCFDYASLAAAMLRSVGIPTKIVTGYVGKDQIYHAWIMVYVDGSWQTAQFKVDPNTWSRCDVTFASTGATQYVGDAGSYTDRYTY